VNESSRVAIAGAGAFGTALALVADRAGRDVVLWGRDAARMREIARVRMNEAHLPGVAVPDRIRVSADPAAIGEADMILLAAPAQGTRSLLTTLAAHVPPGAPVIACAKGIEQASGMLQTDIIAALLPKSRPAALSGPGFAEEIARGLPTAVTVAASEMAFAEELCAALASDFFRPYASDDPTGVELGGAIKNVLAIAAGIVAGRKLGESARAALIARGLAEMMRLGAALGAREETFMGLSGLGDLVLTATSGHSRNLAFGIALARNRRAAELLGADAPLVEGAHTARIAATLAQEHAIEAPIVAAIAGLVEGTISVEAAIAGLVNRPLKRETE
jgi:glycerol-3-phosphate dehydrogenase (NAD(P)+)